MNVNESWQKALRETEVIRSRVQALLTFADTQVPYILLSESRVNEGDTVIRKGGVLVQKPSIILPPNIPQLEGFDFEPTDSPDEVMRFLFLRGIMLPSLLYNNKTNFLDIHEGKLSGAIEYYKELLQGQEDVHTGLIVGPEDCWQFSLLIFICGQVAKNADHDIQKLLEEYKRKNIR